MISSLWSVIEEDYEIQGKNGFDWIPFNIADDDPVLLRKEQQILKSFYETHLPEEVLKRMEKID